MSAQLPDFLVGLGYAVLTFDEQGAGLAPAALAALAATDSLLMRPDIRADLIGLLGLGGGAWVAALAAARVPETALAVLLPGETPLPGDLDRLADVHCPVLAFTPDPNAAALARQLAHNPEVDIQGVPEAPAGMLGALGAWRRQGAKSEFLRPGPAP